MTSALGNLCGTSNDVTGSEILPLYKHVASFLAVTVYVQGHRKRWTGFVFLDLLEQNVFPQIETFEQETVSRVIFM